MKKNKISSRERPLFSFCLFAYNQEDFVRSAVEGAINQSYSPLEIILSDDCSTDRTFEIIKEVVSNYNGPHKIIINQNKKNLGIARHYNCVVELVKGEWLVVAAGDDISMDFRIQTVYDALQKTDNPDRIKYIGTAIDLIKYNGEYRTTSYFNFEQKIMLTGCMAVYSRECFELFQPLDKDVLSEDFVLPFRALLLGDILLINESTVRYREGISNDYFSNFEKYLGFHKKVILAFKQRNKDLDQIKSTLNELLWKKIKNLNNGCIANFNKTSIETKKKEKILRIFKMNFGKRLIYLMCDKELGVKEKMKIILNSLKWLRVLRGRIYNLRTDKRIHLPSETDRIFNIEDVLNQKVLIDGYNDFEFNNSKENSN